MVFSATVSLKRAVALLLTLSKSLRTKCQKTPLVKLEGNLSVPTLSTCSGSHTDQISTDFNTRWSWLFCLWRSQLSEITWKYETGSHDACCLNSLNNEGLMFQCILFLFPLAEDTETPFMERMPMQSIPTVTCNPTASILIEFLDSDKFSLTCVHHVFHQM